MDDDRELLLAAQIKAKRVLDESAERSAECVARAESAAHDLLRAQSKRASDLLLKQHELAATRLHTAEAQASGMGVENGRDLMEWHRSDASDIADEEARVAAALVEAEKQLAARTHDEAMDQARDVLMEGHREAAAILLGARMKVEQRRWR